MSATLVHAYQWDSEDTQRFVSLGIGCDEIGLYEYDTITGVGHREAGFDTEDVVRCFDYNAAVPHLVGYGFGSGAVHIRELRNLGNGIGIGGGSSAPAITPSTSSSSSTSPLVFKQRTTRKCNAVSFNSSGNIIAAGYDRTRGTESVLLWDFASDKHSPASVVSVYDSVAAVRFIPSAPSAGLFAGSRSIRGFDTRTDSVISSVTTQMCGSIVFNPLNDLLFATYGEPSSVALWDRRMLGDSSSPQQEPLLVIPRVFRENTKLDAKCLRFSLENENELAALQDGATIRKWHLSTMPNRKGLSTLSSQLSSGLTHHREDPEDETRSTDSSVPGQGSAAAIVTSAGNSNTSGPLSVSSYGGGVGTAERPGGLASSSSVGPSSGPKDELSSALTGKYTTNSSAHYQLIDFDVFSLFVSRVVDVRTGNDKVVSFDFTNDEKGKLEFECLRQSGTLFRVLAPEVPASIYIDPFNDFRMVAPPATLLETTKDGRLNTSDLALNDSRLVLDKNTIQRQIQRGEEEEEESGTGRLVNTDQERQGPGSGQGDKICKDGTNLSTTTSSSTAATTGNTSGNNKLQHHSHSRHVKVLTAVTETESEDSDESEESNENDIASDNEEDHSTPEYDLRTLLINDIANTMEKRALAGYSLDAAKNIELLNALSSSSSLSGGTVSAPGSTGSTGNAVASSSKTPRGSIAGASMDTALVVSSSSSSGLIAAWKWVHQQNEMSQTSRNYLETPELDLRYIGVLNMWEGLSVATLKPRLAATARVTSKTVHDAVKYAVRKAPGSVFVSADDDLRPYRELCLRLTGWDFGLSELEPQLAQLEAEGKFEKAAGWAVFHNNIERAVESLAKSRKKNLKLMSTAVAGYLVYKDVPTNNVWREQCRRLASELSGPYLRAIFAYIADGSWLDVLDDGALPLVERIGIALRFLPQKEVGKYLSLLTARAISRGDLEGIVLTGFTPETLNLLQAYLDRSGDIQTVCLLASFGWPRFFKDSRLPTWFAEYRELLNSWQYFAQRARLDIARNKLVPSRYSHAKPPISGQAFLRCTHCKKMVTVSRSKFKITPMQIWNRCPTCNHPLPPCGVCTLPLGPSLDDETESDRWPTFCLKCNHGFHSVHARQWFDKYDICPIPSCTCLCAKTATA